LRYVRYADDFSIYTKSNSAARKVGNQIYLFLQEKLKLPINREKSGICKPVQFGLLGYQFVPTYKKGDKGRYQLVSTDESWKNLKEKLKAVTKKTSPISFEERIVKLKEIQRGWVNYFRMASLTGKLKDPNGRLGGSTKSYSTDDHYPETLSKTRLPIYAGILPESFPIS
jgi:hypothetical protein